MFSRVLNVRRLALAGSPMARGVLLFCALVLFTLLYALVLGWLSQTGDNAAKAPAAPPAAAAPVVAAAPAARVAVAESFRAIDDRVAASAAEGFTYSGQWQHLANMPDGRSQGTSSRTYHVGATASFDFTGDHLKIFGVKGPNGGYAELRIDGQTYGLLRFYGPHKAAGVLIYASPILPAGPHAVEIVVAQPPKGLPKRRFVNLDGASYAGRSVR